MNWSGRIARSLVVVALAVALGAGSAGAAGMPLTRLSFALPVAVPDEGQVWATDLVVESA